MRNASRSVVNAWIRASESSEAAKSRSEMLNLLDQNKDLKAYYQEMVNTIVTGKGMKRDHYEAMKEICDGQFVDVIKFARGEAKTIKRFT